MATTILVSTRRRCRPSDLLAFLFSIVSHFRMLYAAVTVTASANACRRCRGVNWGTEICSAE